MSDTHTATKQRRDKATGNLLFVCRESTSDTFWRQSKKGRCQLLIRSQQRAQLLPESQNESGQWFRENCLSRRDYIGLIVLDCLCVIFCPFTDEPPTVVLITLRSSRRYLLWPLTFTIASAGDCVQGLIETFRRSQEAEEDEVKVRAFTGLEGPAEMVRSSATWIRSSCRVTCFHAYCKRGALRTWDDIYTQELIEGGLLSIESLSSDTHSHTHTRYAARQSTVEHRCSLLGVECWLGLGAPEKHRWHADQCELAKEIRYIPSAVTLPLNVRRRPGSGSEQHIESFCKLWSGLIVISVFERFKRPERWVKVFSTALKPGREPWLVSSSTVSLAVCSLIHQSEQTRELNLKIYAWLAR